MERIDAVLTQLALDPFESLLLRDSSVTTRREGTFSAADLRTALASTDHIAIAGADWSACETCSDPGTDDHDPFRD
jgi:hypothetical protein